MKIEVDSTYYDAEGNEVEIIFYDATDPTYPYQGDNKKFYTATGRISAIGTSPKDLIKRKGSMNKEEFFEFVEQTQKNMLTLMKAKNKDYTAGQGPFANFEGAADFGVDPLVGLMLRMSDKFQRVKAYAKNNQLAVPGEGLEDAFKDIIGYSHLALGILHDKK